MEVDFSQKLNEAMEKAGVHIDGDINWFSQEFQRFRIRNRYKKGRPLFVVLNDGCASFGDWHDPATWRTVWERSWGDISHDERLARKAHQERLVHERELLRNHAIWRAQEMLRHHTFRGRTCQPPSMDHPYIKKKRIIPYYAHQIRSYLVLPITDVDRKLISLQYIKSNGFKQFKKHASPKGGMMFLAEDIQKDDTIRVCEGYATGCSIYEAIGAPVVVAFSASNVLNVSVLLRTKYRFNHIQICADNDHWTKQNTGLIFGLEAAKASGGKIVWPDFTGLDASNRPTDFNDLFCLRGIEMVENQLLGIK